MKFVVVYLLAYLGTDQSVIAAAEGVEEGVVTRYCDNPPRKIPYYHLIPIHFSH
jgi:hypothetical protein